MLGGEFVCLFVVLGVRVVVVLMFIVYRVLELIVALISFVI